MRTRDRMYCQMIRTVRDIYRDDRARIATCTLGTPTDRHKENYSIDACSCSRNEDTLHTRGLFRFPTDFLNTATFQLTNLVGSILGLT